MGLTPLDLARRMAESDDETARATGAAIIARGLSDESPTDPYRQPWPVDVSVERAIAYLGLTDTPEFRALVTRRMALLSDAMLNRAPR